MAKQYLQLSGRYSSARRVANRNPNDADAAAKADALWLEYLAAKRSEQIRVALTGLGELTPTERRELAEWVLAGSIVGATP